VFADTLYLGALIRLDDQHRRSAVQAQLALGDAHLVTTDEVLAELLDGLSQRGPNMREAAVQAVQKLLADSRVTVHPQSHESFLAGIELYHRRNDKGYSLVDCVSMNTMRREEISEILTNDHHFAQEGFTTLLG
jgi:predicted nucleic acid-binding protein